MPALGEEFRSAREARGLTLSDVAEQIHIRSVYLNAIENEEWSSIGAPVYVRGFIRTYARFLALDAESAVERFNQASPPERSPAHSAPTIGTGRGRPGPSGWAIGATLIAVLLVAFAGYEWWSYSQTPAGAGGTSAHAGPGGTQPGGGSAGSQRQAPDLTPAVSPSQRPPPPVRHQLAIRLTERSWLRVTVDGVTKVEGILPAGTARTFSGNVADVRVGNAGGVTVSVDGSRPATMGKTGDVVEQRYTL